MTPFLQDPSDVADYLFDWSLRLIDDPIQTSSFLADSGITVESDAIIDILHTVVWLSGGTRNKRYAITNHVLTLGGREYEWTIYVLVKER